MLLSAVKVYTIDQKHMSIVSNKRTYLTWYIIHRNYRTFRISSREKLGVVLSAVFLSRNIDGRKKNLGRRNSLVLLRRNLRKEQRKKGKKWEGRGERRQEDLSQIRRELNRNESLLSADTPVSFSRGLYDARRLCFGFYRPPFACLFPVYIYLRDRRYKKGLHLFISITLGWTTKWVVSLTENCKMALIPARPRSYFNYADLCLIVVPLE